MQITLVRHGPPTPCHRGWLTRAEFGAWARAYNAAGLRAGAAPPARVLRLAREAAIIVSSDLRRARESAALLRPEAPVAAWPLLREADLPAAEFAPAARLPLGAWLVVARVGWTGAWLPSVEPFAAARARAERAAGALDEVAAREGAIVAVGHAIFHSLVANSLRQRGWRGAPWWGTRYWASVILRRDA